MRNFITLLLLLGSLLGSVSSQVHALEGNPAIENTLLRAEYEIARKGQIYLYLNFEKKIFEIRSSGITVSTIPISDIRPWGPLPEPGLHLIADKDRVPEREKIQIPPPGGETSTPAPAPPPPPPDPTAPPVVKKFDVQATEVTDMPSSYTLRLEGGGTITIKSFQEALTWKEKMAQRYERPLWKISHALQASLSHYKGKNFSELLLILSHHDAQRLYWALPVGSALLIPAAQP